MFLRRQVYDDLWSQLIELRERVAAAIAERDTLRAQDAHQHQTIGFLCARLNQVEGERLALLRQVTRNSDLPNAPEFRAETRVHTPQDVSNAIAEAGSLFEDVGDDRARKLGINWEADGTVNYSDRPIAAAARVS